MRVSNILVALLVLSASLTVFAVPSSAAPEYTQIDLDHDLATDDAVNNWHSQGKVSTDLLVPKMSVTVSESKSGVNMSSTIDFSPTTNYLKIDYEEDKPRVVRMYIPSEIIEPYTNDDLKSVVGNGSASVEPVDNRNYTSVMVELNGNQDVYIFEIDTVAGASASFRDSWLDRYTEPFSDDKDDNKTSEWQYISSTDISESYEINVGKDGVNDDDYRIQYLNEDEEWVTVPPSETSQDPYYIRTRTGINDTVWITSVSNDTPQVRYKTAISSSERASDVASGIGDVVDQILKDIPFL